VDVRDVMDVIATHSVAAAAAVDSKFVDVAVGFTAAKGKCIRIYYGGEVEPARMGADKVLNASLVGERIVIDALWPIASSGHADQRTLIGQMYLLKHELRTRILGDSQLGGDTTDLAIEPATIDEVIFGGLRGTGQHYLQLRMEVHCDYTEYAIAA
jgi:hypothetical protein